MQASEFLSIANNYGSVDIRDELSDEYAHISGPRLQPLCRKLGIKYANALIGFEEKGRKAKYGYAPILDGVVIPSNSADQLHDAIEERRRRTEKRGQLTAEQKNKRKEDRQKKDERKLLNAIVGLFPSIPNEEAQDIATHASEIGSGRVGRTSTISLEEVAHRAVVAHVRHNHTDYEDILRQNYYQGMDREIRQKARDHARLMVADEIGHILKEWEAETAKVEQSVESNTKHEESFYLTINASDAIEPSDIERTVRELRRLANRRLPRKRARRWNEAIDRVVNKPNIDTVHLAAMPRELNGYIRSYGLPEPTTNAENLD